MSNDITILNKPQAIDLSSALHDYAAETVGIIEGLRLKFNKGLWTVDEAPAVLTDTYRAELHTLTRAWECWHDRHIVKRVGAYLGEQLPQRSVLGENDPSGWEVGLDKKPKDPWSLVHYLGLTRLRDNEQIAFATSSYGGRKAIGKLAQGASCRPGELPTVILSSSEYDHPVYGLVKTPVFDAIRWTKTPGAGGPTAIAPDYEIIEHRGVSVAPDVVPFDDEMPF